MPSHMSKAHASQPHDIKKQNLNWPHDLRQTSRDFLWLCPNVIRNIFARTQSQKVLLQSLRLHLSSRGFSKGKGVEIRALEQGCTKRICVAADPPNCRAIDASCHTSSALSPTPGRSWNAAQLATTKLFLSGENSDAAWHVGSIANDFWLTCLTFCTTAKKCWRGPAARPHLLHFKCVSIIPALPSGVDSAENWKACSFSMGPGEQLSQDWGCLNCSEKENNLRMLLSSEKKTKGPPTHTQDSIRGPYTHKHLHSSMHNWWQQSANGTPRVERAYEWIMTRPSRQCRSMRFHFVGLITVGLVRTTNDGQSPLSQSCQQQRQ